MGAAVSPVHYGKLVRQGKWRKEQLKSTPGRVVTTIWYIRSARQHMLEVSEHLVNGQQAFYRASDFLGCVVDPSLNLLLGDPGSVFAAP